MKCGNNGCDYELYAQEADFLVCPGCAKPVLLDRARSVDCDRRLHTPADRVIDRSQDLRFYRIFALAITGTTLFSWYYGGPNQLEQYLSDWGQQIFLNGTNYAIGFALAAGLTAQVVPKMRLWVDDPNWITNTKAQLLIRSLPYAVWAIATMVLWSMPSVANLQAALAQIPGVAEAHPQMVTASIWGAYLVPLITAGVGILGEGLEVINQRNIARLNALIVRKSNALPPLCDEGPTEIKNELAH